MCLKGEKIHHFVYISKLIGSDRFYIGKHSCASLDCGYVGSGRWIKDCLNAGREFNRDIVFEFSSNLKALDYEVELIKEMKRLYPSRCMNFLERFTPDSIGKYRTKEQNRLNSERQKGKKLSEETKRRMSASKIGVLKSEETKRKMGLARKGTVVSEETKAILREYRLKQNISYEDLCKGKEKRKKWIVCLKTGMVFKGLQAVANFWGISVSWARQICDGRKTSVKFELEYMQ